MRPLPRETGTPDSLRPTNGQDARYSGSNGSQMYAHCKRRCVDQSPVNTGGRLMGPVR